MESGHADRDDTAPAGEWSAVRKGRPTNHVVAVINSVEEATRTIQALTAGGFLDSEIHPLAGRAAADTLHANTGRTGLSNLAIRIADRLGIADDEMELKSVYEQALRDGHVLLAIESPTEARRERAAQILHDHGAHSVNFLGRFAITEFAPPQAPESRP